MKRFAQYLSEQADVEAAIRAFTSRTDGIVRTDMPQIRSVRMDDFKAWLVAQGIKTSYEKVPAKSLYATQKDFKTERLMPLLDKPVIEGPPVLVSRDGFVLDGHHRVLAKRIRGEDIHVMQIDAPIEDLLKVIKTYPYAEYHTN
jgi:hypothetical protein